MFFMLFVALMLAIIVVPRNNSFLHNDTLFLNDSHWLRLRATYLYLHVWSTDTNIDTSKRKA